MDVTSKLNEMIRSGLKYEYRGREIEFLNFEERDGRYFIDIIDNNRNERIEKEDPVKAYNFLILCTPIFDEEITETEEVKTIDIVPANQKKEYVPKLLEENKENFKSLADMLMEDIRKVRKNPKYVQQAKQTSNSANALINLVKLQMNIIDKG